MAAQTANTIRSFIRISHKLVNGVEQLADDSDVPVEAQIDQKEANLVVCTLQ
jgi:hypothetical protein